MLYCWCVFLLFNFILSVESYNGFNLKNSEGVLRPYVRVKRIVGGEQSNAPPEDAPVVFITKENHSAVVYGTREGKYPRSYYRFYGLRYAEPPVGRLRFQRPRLLKPKGLFNATKPGAPCLQPDPEHKGNVVGSEDCLFLNIFSPQLPSSDESLPVLMWIHGGGYRRGSANQYGAGNLASRDLIVVTVQYRLGSLGFMSAQTEDMSGNMALFDLATALEWIKRYIRFFGGDPDNVMTAGQGTGGSSAMLLGLSNITQSKLSGIIAMSGSAVSPFALNQQPVKVAQEIATSNKCPEKPVFEMVKCLQQLPPEDFVKSDNKLEDDVTTVDGFLNNVGGMTVPAPVVQNEDDHRFLPPAIEEKPSTSYHTHHIPKIPLLTGVTKHETANVIMNGYGQQLIDNIKNIPQYIDKVFVSKVMGVSANSLYHRAEDKLSAIGQITNNYLKLRVPGLGADSITAALNQAIEVTSDGLFNFPAVLSSSSWQENNVPSYFYSFDHSGDVRGSETLLKGTQFEGGHVENTIGHGEDLPYLFDIRSLDGAPHPEHNESSPFSRDDEKVREFYSNMISNFAKHKQVNVGKTKNAAKYPSYVSVVPEPTVNDKFRDCQMSLWSGGPAGVTNKVCETLGALSSKFLSGFKGVKDGAGGAVDYVKSGAGNIGSKAKSGIGSVFGSIG